MTKLLTRNKKLIDWVNKISRMCQPDDIVWIDGSHAQKEILRRLKS